MSGEAAAEGPRWRQDDMRLGSSGQRGPRRARGRGRVEGRGVRTENEERTRSSEGTLSCSCSSRTLRDIATTNTSTIVWGGARVLRRGGVTVGAAGVLREGARRTRGLGARRPKALGGRRGRRRAGGGGGRPHRGEEGPPEAQHPADHLAFVCAVARHALLLALDVLVQLHPRDARACARTRGRARPLPAAGLWQSRLQRCESIHAEAYSSW